MPPSWLLAVFAAIMLLVAALSAGRLLVRAVARPRAAAGADVDIAHLFMGVAMAGVLAPGAGTLPAGGWQVIFGACTVWFGWRVARDLRARGGRALAAGHAAPHLVHAAAMVYMFGATATGAAAGRSLAHPTLALVFGLALAGYGVWDLDQLSGRRYRLAVAPAAAAPGITVTIPASGRPAAPGREQVLSAAVTVACRIAMGVTMAFMLLVMI